MCVYMYKIRRTRVHKARTHYQLFLKIFILFSLLRDFVAKIFLENLIFFRMYQLKMF